jgi:predicted ester cyclase
MQPEENKAVVRIFLEEVCRGRNVELADELFTPDYVLHDFAAPKEVRGPEGMKWYMSMYRAAYPDTSFTIEDQIAEGEKVVTRGTGHPPGRAHGHPPTGERVTVTGIEFDRVSGGRIEETWVSYDALGMMRQLGVIPPPEQAGA